MLKRSWSITADKNYTHILDYLFKEWSAKDAHNFANKVEKVLLLAEKNPSAYKILHKDIHQAVVSRQISLFYRVSGRKLKILSLFDTRQHPNKLKI